MSMTGSSAAARRYRIAGRVQGVAFRYHTREVARSLGLRGWVRNLADGRVEVLACGPPERLAALERWLARGPELAAVGGVEVTEADPPAGPGFEIAPTAPPG